MRGFLLVLLLLPSVASAQTLTQTVSRDRMIAQGLAVLSDVSADPAAVAQAVAHDSAAYTIAVGSSIGAGIGQFLDVYSTALLFGIDPQAYEANRALRWSTAQTAWGLGAVKGSIAAAQQIALWKLRQQHPKWATFVAGVSMGLSGYATVHNARLVHQAGR